MSRLGFGTTEPYHVSNVSVPAEEDVADAKSDVSSLNELEKFNFERDTRVSEASSMLGNILGGRSGDSLHAHSPVGSGTGHEIPWMQ
jgi:hypothetical protein